jgi:serine/threonine protein kinase
VANDLERLRKDADMESQQEDNPSSSARAQSIARVIEAIRDAQEAGTEIDFDTITEAHPDLMPELQVSLDNFRRIAEARAVIEAEPTSAGRSAHATTSPTAHALIDELEKTNVKVPGYSIIRQLCRGGQANVFLALQLSTGRKIAIKVLRDGSWASDKALARFKREVQILAAMHHPNIGSIIDTGKTHEGARYITMPYIAGSSLDEFMRDQQQNESADPGKLLQLFLKICEAVDAAHSRGIVHRDLKPSNIRIDDRGEPHVLDFGLARTPFDDLVSPNQAVSVTGEFLGSLPWSSPEQAAGDPDNIDIRTDVYSLGIILYQMLTGGRFPYEVVGNMRDVLNNIVSSNPVPPSKIMNARVSMETIATRVSRSSLPAVNEGIERIVLKALAKKPELRYQTAGELGRDVGKYLDGQRTNTPLPAIRPARRYKLAGAIAASVLIGVFAFAAHYGLFGRHAPAPQPSDAHTAASPLKLTIPAVAADGPAKAEPAKPLPPSAPTPQAADVPKATFLSGSFHVEGDDLVMTPKSPGSSCAVLFGDPSWTDYDFSLKAITNANPSVSERGHSTATFGAQVRSATSTSFVQMQFGLSGNNINQIYINDGEPQRRFGRVEPDHVYNIRIQVRGPDFHFFVDDEEWFSTHNTLASLSHGRVGISSASPAQRFRDFKVTAPDGKVLWSGLPDLSGLYPQQKDPPGSIPPIPPLRKANLLSLADPAKNSAAGTWTLKSNILTCDSERGGQIQFPKTPPEQYDYRVTFVRKQGTGGIALIGSEGGHAFSCGLDGRKPMVTGLAQSYRPRENQSPEPRIIDGKQHTFVMAVRKDIVKTYLDSWQISQTNELDYSTVRPGSEMVPMDPKTVGLWTSGPYTILSADILEVDDLNTSVPHRHD